MIEKDLVDILLKLSITWIVKLVGPPALVGVPEITPEELKDNQEGNDPETIDQLYGLVPLLAIRVWE